MRFSSLKSPNLDLNNPTHSVRHVMFDEGQLNHESPRRSTREFSEQSTCDQKTVVNYLHSMRKKDYTDYN